MLKKELSKRNKYWIPKHRYFELKYFCLQYPDWKRTYTDLDGYGSTNYDYILRGNSYSDPTARLVEQRSQYFDKMKLIEQAAIGADSELSIYILRAVTEGLSYTQLKSRLDIPCGRDMYYDRYRRFFWLLDKTRN